jgi:hypothetical protein
VHLPSGLAVTVDVRGEPAPRERAPAAPLFSELGELLASGDVKLLRADDAAPVDAPSLALRDFHALRAIATRLGWLAEEAVDFPCRNCAAPLVHRPCAALELGPFVDGELDDAELDATLDLGAAHPIPAVHLTGGDVAREVKLGPLTAADAAPLHRALRRRSVVVSERVVRAMGVEALGPLRDARRVAAALARCPEEAWEAIGDLFLRAHYPLRLSSTALCPKCGARNDVDAPYDREFVPSRPTEQSNEEVFPDVDAFDARARASFERIAGGLAGQVTLAVHDGVPDCDDGGEPLMGAYVPPGGDPSAPVGAGQITLYYRTFLAMWREDGAYDWEGEIDETIDHELEHHEGWRVGHDPMDDEERAEIAHEHARVVGRRTAARASVRALGADFGADLSDFFARTWPIWLIVAAATIAITVCGR